MIRFCVTIAVLALLGCRASVHAEALSGSFAQIGNDTTVRFFHEASVLPTGHVLVTGGMRLQFLPPSLISLDDMSFLDPTTNTFSSSFSPTGGGADVMPSLITPRSSHTQVTLVDGRVLIAGGRTAANGPSPGTPVSSVELFDPTTGLVSAGPEMSSPRAGHTATVLPDGCVVVAGGSTFEIFNPGSNLWSGPFSLAHTRSDHAAVLVEDFLGTPFDRVLLIGGSGNGRTTMEMIEPEFMTSAAMTSTLATGVDDVAAAMLESGVVLIVGGQNLATGDTIDDAYLLHPELDEIEPIAPPPGLTNGVADHVMLSTGRFVFMCGGESQQGGADTELDQFRVFDAATQQWVFAGQTPRVHDDHAAVVLDDGRIVVIDGGAPFLGEEAPTDVTDAFTPSPPLTGDLNCDGFVGFADLTILLAAWGDCDDFPAACPHDIDASGTVGFSDLTILLGEWPF